MLKAFDGIGGHRVGTPVHAKSVRAGKGRVDEEDEPWAVVVELLEFEVRGCSLISNVIQ